MNIHYICLTKPEHHFLASQFLPKLGCSETFKAVFDELLRNIQAEAIEFVSYKKRV